MFYIRLELIGDNGHTLKFESERMGLRDYLVLYAQAKSLLRDMAIPLPAINAPIKHCLARLTGYEHEPLSRRRIGAYEVRYD